MAPPPEPPPPGPQLRAIEQLVRQSLLPYGAQAAKVLVTWGAAIDAWFVEVEPRRQGAAPVSVGLSVRGSLLVTVANTSMDDSVTDEGADLAWLGSLIDNVFAGRVEEIGRRSNSYVRLGVGRPDATAFGAAPQPPVGAPPGPPLHRLVLTPTSPSREQCAPTSRGEIGSPANRWSFSCCGLSSCVSSPV